MYIANSKDIKIIDFRVAGGSALGNRQVKEIVPQHGQFMQYYLSGKCKLLEFFETHQSHAGNYIMCALETSDYQVDFAKLTFFTREMAVGDIEFAQLREVVKRYNVNNDPIVKFRQFITESDLGYACSLR